MARPAAAAARRAFPRARAAHHRPDRGGDPRDQPSGHLRAPGRAERDHGPGRGRHGLRARRRQGVAVRGRRPSSPSTDAVQRLYLGHGSDQPARRPTVAAASRRRSRGGRSEHRLRGRPPRRRGGRRPSTPSRSEFGAIKALSDVSFTVQPGTVHAVIGPNGAGKSTMFNVLSGVYRASSGEVRLGEHGAHGDAAAPDRPARGGAGVPEHRPLQHPDGRREPHARPPLPDPVRGSSPPGCGCRGRPGRAGDTVNASGRSASSSGSARSSTSRSACCPTGTRSGSKLPAPCAPSPGCCCSTSRWPA